MDRIGILLIEVIISNMTKKTFCFSIINDGPFLINTILNPSRRGSILVALQKILKLF